MRADAHQPDQATAPNEARHTDLLIDDGVRLWTAPDSVTPDAASFRRELGIPDDRAVVMTGHQPVFWHAGILAKYLAADALACRDSAQGRPTVAAWCVPDHTADAPGRVAYPAPSDRGPGRWERLETDLFAHEDAVPGTLQPVRDRLAVADGATPAERQISAHRAVLRDRLGLESPAPTVVASRLHATAAFADLVGRMLDDPNACASSYNDAAAAHPDAGVRPLAIDREDPGDTELPLWAVSAAGTLIAARAGDVRDAGRAALRPRALLFTGLLRALGCDLFIHGTGGGAYDLVTEMWMREWLGRSLAPVGVVTATLTLDLGVPEVTRSDLREARWRAHHARHNPGRLGGAAALRDADAEKRALVDAIAHATDRSGRARLFAELHALLARVRAVHGDAIGALDDRTASIAAALADRGLAHDRTWAWMLHNDRDLDALRDDIARVITGER